MKISNFVLVETAGNTVFKATVEVETGILFWKKRKTKEIHREYVGFWFFVDTGKQTPGFVVERLARSWKAKTGQKC